MLSYKFEKTYLTLIISLIILFSYFTILSMNENKEANGNLYNYSVISCFISLLIYIVFNTKYLVKKKGLSIIFGLWILMITIVFVVTESVSSINMQILNYLKLLFPILTFYYFNIVFKNKNLIKFYLNTIIVFTVLLVYFYFREYTLINIISKEEKALNIAYFPFLMLPAIMCINIKFVRYSLLFLIIVVIFSSMKRGGLIALFLSLGGYYIIEKLFKKRNSLNLKNIINIIFILGIAWIFFLIFNRYSGSAFLDRLKMIEEDKGSGREDIYENVLGLLQNSSYKDIIIGHGDNAVSRYTDTGYSAHNDFLEVIFDYGLISFLIYICLHISIIKIAINLIKHESRYAAPFMISYVQFLVFSLISHIIIYPYFILLTMFWGVITGITYRNQVLKLN